VILGNYSGQRSPKAAEKGQRMKMEHDEYEQTGFRWPVQEKLCDFSAVSALSAVRLRE